MDIERGYLVVCVVIVLVVLFNVGLVLSLTSPAAREQWRLMVKLTKQARNPWQSQNTELSELRDRVARIEEHGHQAQEPDD